MFHTRTRMITALTAGTLLLAPLAGCGGDDTKKPASAQSNPTSSSSPTGSTGSAEPSPGASTPNAQTAAFISDALAAMQTQKTARMELQFGDAVKADAEVRYGATTEAKLTVHLGTTDLQVIVTDGAVYTQQPGSAKFVKINKDDPALGQLSDLLAYAGPREALEAFKTGVKSVQEVGPKTIDGVKLTQYAVTVDPKAAGPVFPGAEESTVKELKLNLYVDSGKLLRRVEGDVGGQKLVLKVLDWGKPVNIEAPKASQLIQNR